MKDLVQFIHNQQLTNKAILSDDGATRTEKITAEAENDAFDRVLHFIARANVWTGKPLLVGWENTPEAFLARVNVREMLPA